MPNDPAVSAIPWGLEVMDRASLSGGRDSLEGRSSIGANLSSDLEANRERLFRHTAKPRRRVMTPAALPSSPNNADPWRGPSIIGLSDWR